MRSSTSGETVLLHVISSQEWESVRQGSDYRPESLSAEGFIHCSLIDQIVGVANRFYSGSTDRLLLVLDPALIASEVVFEDLYGHGDRFPHIYGPLNLDAVIDVVKFPCDDTGTFSLPPGLG